MNRFEGKHVVLTGGAKGIGRETCRRFVQEGAQVFTIDLLPVDEPGVNGFVGDVGEQADLEAFAAHVLAHCGTVDVIVNNALPLMRGIDECSYADFLYAQRVGVVAPFFLVKLFKDHLGQGASIINIASTRAWMSQPQTESYSAAKGGIAALTHALAASLGPKARVNAISPGWINTTSDPITGADAAQQPCGHAGVPADIASLVCFLASDEANFITGQNITVDGGMTSLMIYHGEWGWQYQS